MLVEYVGPEVSKTVFHKGQTYNFVPHPDYENARVVDVIDKEAIVHVLNITDVAGRERRFRKYPMDALRDPDFLRHIDRNPAAARRRLVQIEAGEVELDLKQIEWELKHSTIENLRLYAAEQGIALNPNYLPHRMIEVLMEKFRKLSKAPITEAAETLAEAEPADGNGLTETVDLATPVAPKVRPRGRPRKRVRKGRPVPAVAGKPPKARIEESPKPDFVVPDQVEA